MRSPSAMYKIIGGDGREYGPVTADQIQQWVQEGRAARSTRVQLEGSGEWKTLGDFPEFADILGQPTQATPPPPVYIPEGDYQQAILHRQAQLDVGQCLSSGLSLLLANFGLFFGAVLIFWLIQQVMFIPMLGGLVYIVLYGPLVGGLSVIYLRRIRGEPAAIGDLFSLFGTSFLPLMLVGILTSLLTNIGFFFCGLPYIYLSVAWVFALALVADRRLDFWSAMELSRRVVSRKWFQIFALMFVAFLPAILFKLYLNIEAIQALYPVIAEGIKTGRPDDAKMQEVIGAFTYMEFQRQIVLLLILPFASAVLMQAYEALFGTRKTPRA